jgi:hypothetical protein
MPDVSVIAITAAVTTTVTVLLTRILNMDRHQLKRRLIFAALAVPMGMALYIIKTFSPHTPATGADVEHAVILVGMFAMSLLVPVLAVIQTIVDYIVADREDVTPPPPGAD